MLRVILEPKTAVFRISEGHVNNYWFSLDFDSIGFVCFFFLLNGLTTKSTILIISSGKSLLTHRYKEI